MSQAFLRLANVSDADSILAVYSPYIVETCITFETVVPTVEEFANRIDKIQQKYPYLVLERDKKVIGYAYAHEFAERAAFRWSAETSIYLAKDASNAGLGRILYSALIDILKLQNIKKLYGLITSGNTASNHLHERLGFNFIYRLSKVGFKFDGWQDLLYFEKTIASQDGHPDEVLPIASVIPHIVLDNWNKRLHASIK